ncbi:hypothetical protein GCM10009733_005750 [Nonomuraea maheshkhaliensis]|uniref:Uncharacterized protein n=1 Tax=Nonomuraea maheshkhaliensis TaxID=419590 RepID=A0ABP4QK79_9ACTN
MAAKTQIFHPGKPGIWPGGEPQTVRDAYDELLAQQEAERIEREQARGAQR